MKVIIDRFEGDFAVVECDGRMMNIPRALVGGAKEGDAVMITPMGKNAELPGEEEPRGIFERLRRRRKRRR